MKINVNNHNWNIIFTSDLNDLMINGIIHLGVTDKIKNTVYLDDGLNGNLLRKVLLHELTHVWCYSYGYVLTREEEEFLCSFVDTYAQDIIEHADDILGGNYHGYTYKTKRPF